MEKWAACACTVVAAGLALWRWRLLLRCGLPHANDSASLVSLLPPVSQIPLPPAYSIWEHTAARLADLNRTGQLHATIEAMPVIRVGDLAMPELRRARVLLGCLVASFAHGRSVPWHCLEVTQEAYTRAACDRYRYIAEANPTPAPTVEDANVTPLSPISLPLSIALPWREVSERLGMPPVIVATDLDLWNRGSTLALSPALALRDYRQMFSMTGTASERGFHAVPFAMQLALAPLLPSLLGVPALVLRRNAAEMQRVCEHIEAAITEARVVLRSVYDLVWADEFYDVYRPLLGGWAPQGIRLPALPGTSGASSHSGGEYVAKSGGPSAGQTAIFIVIDLVLGVEHGPKLIRFQREMREYLPAEHRQLIEALDTELLQSGHLRSAAHAADAPAGLAAAHAAALQSLAGLRAYHLGIATHYLRRALKGTGGSDFRSLLDEGVQSTRRCASA